MFVLVPLLLGLRSILVVDPEVILIKLHGPDGQVIYINPQTVVSVRPPRKSDIVGPNLHCLLHTTDGKFIAVTETCEDFVSQSKERVPFPALEEPPHE